ncbi:hypothetical protein DsansV1_C06g0063351 [Dioscorea sansibarensis]
MGRRRTLEQRQGLGGSVTAFWNPKFWRSPRLACRGSVVDQFVSHIRRRVETLNG